MAGPWEAYKKNQGTQQSPQAARNAQPGAWAAYKSSENYKDDVKNYKKTYKSATRTMKAQAERAAKLFQGRDARREEERQEQTDARNEKRAALREAQKQVTQMTAAGLPLAVQRQRTLGQMDANGLYARYRAALAEVGEVDRDALPRDTKRAEGGRAVYEFGEALKSKSAGTLGRYAQKPEKTAQELEKEAVRTGGSDAAMAKWQNHWTEDLFQQYLTAMNATPAQMAKRGEMLAGMTWGKEEKQAAKELLENAKTQGLTGNAYNPSNYAPAWEAWLRGDEEEYAKQVEIYDQLYTRLHPKSRAVMTAATEAFGLNSAAKIGAKLAGDETAVRTLQSNEKTGRWAQALNPGLTVATKTIVSLGLMKATGGILGAAMAPLAKGATVLGKAALEAGKSALTFAAKDAIQNAGNVATGEMSGSEFAKQIAGSAAGGVAGNIMSGLVSSGIAKVLTEKQMMTPFMEYLKNVAGSMAFSTGSLAANTAVSGRKMSGEEIATELTTSFAFALVNGYMQSMASTKAASRAVEQKYDQIAQEFEAIQKHMSGKQFATQAEYEQALKDLRAHVQELKTEVSSTYYGGQQEFVNSMKDALDVVVNNLNWMLSGNTGAAPASGASGMQAADVKLLTEQAASALRSGANEPIGPQGGAAGSLAQAESTAVNDNPVQHTPAEQRVIEAYKGSADKGLAEFYQRAKTDQNAGRYTLQTVTERAADDIRNLTGQDVDGFKTTLDARQAWHINNDHGANGKADHSMENDEDVARMQYVLNNYDSAEYGGTTDAYWESKKNGKSRRSPVVVFSKKVNGTYYIVEATPVTKAKSVYVVSAYMLGDGKTPPGRSGQNKTGANPQPPDASAPWLTSENDSAEITPENSVTQEAEAVKREEWLPENMEVEDRNENGIPDNMEVVSGAEDAGAASAAETGTSTQTEQNTASGAQEVSEPEVRTVLRKATGEDARALLKGTDLFAGKQGALLREYKGRLKQYDERVRELAQTTDPEKSRILQNQIEADEAYLTRREETLRQTADIARARMQNEARQQEADIAEPDPDELRTLERRTQREEQQTEQAAQKGELKADEDMLARFAERKGYSDLLTSYVISGYGGYHESTGKPVEQYAAGIGQAYTQGAQGMKLRATEQMSGIPQAVLQQAYESGKEQNGGKSENDGGKRDAGVDPGQPGRRVEKSTGSAAEKQRGELSVQERIGLENRLRAAGRTAVSTKELGIQAGTDAKTAWEIPQNIAQEYPALQRARKTLTDAGAENVHFVTGTLRVTGENGQSVTVQAITQGTSVWMKASDVQHGLQETAEHEAMHLRLAEAPSMKGRLITAIRKQMTATELNQLAQRYAEAYEGCYGEDMDAYLEEILCDAYAGINRVGMKADRYQSAVREAAGEAQTQQAKKKPEATRGPPVKLSKDTSTREQTQREITERYQNEVHEILENGKRSTGALVVGYTPELYRKLGMPELPFVIGGGHVYSIAKTRAEAEAEGRAYKNVNYHGLGESTVANILELLKKPVMVIASKDVDKGTTPLRSTHSVVALVDVGKNGKSLVIPVSITAESTVDGTVMDVNMLSSAYERNVSGLVNEAVAQFNAGENSVFYVQREAATLLGEGVQFPSILEAAAASNGIVRRFDEKINMSVKNVTQSQQFKRWFGDWQNQPEKASKVVNADGTPKVVYHQTDGEFTVFDTRKQGAGTRDSETPFGIFMKSSDRDIGLRGKKQMALYANIRNPLIAQNRADLKRQLRTMSADYAALTQQHEELDQEYRKKFQNANENFKTYILDWRKKHPGTDSRELYGTAEFERLFNEEDRVSEEWTEKADELSLQEKNTLTDALRSAGYDGVHLLNDAGSFGRSTDAWIALNPNQVKSAADNVGTFGKNNPDIRFSTETQERAPMPSDADAPPMTEWEQMQQEQREADEEGERLRRVEQAGRRYLRKALNDATWELAEPMSAAGEAVQQTIRRRLDALADEYIATGKIKSRSSTAAFEALYTAAGEGNREFAKQYAGVRNVIWKTAITLTNEQRTELAAAVENEQEVRARALKDLYVVPKNGTDVGTLYAKLHDKAPELFPSQKAEAWQQIMQISTVNRRIAKAEILDKERRSSDPQYFKDKAYERFNATLQKIMPQLKQAREYAQSYQREQDAAREELIRREAETAREDARLAEEAAQEEQKKVKAYSYDALPTKARQYLNAAVNRQAGRMAATMDIPGQQKRELLKPALRQMMEEYLQTGRVEQSTIDKTFDDAYNAGLVEDREFYDTYKFIKDKMRTTGVAITPQIRADIADFGQFRKNAMGRLLMKDSGMPVDVFYAELHDEAPGLFPSSITNPTDQLEQMFAVSKTIEVTKKALDESYGEQAEEFKRWARNDYEAGIGEFFAQLRTARRYAEAAERNAQVQYTPKTVEEATKLGEDMRKARKNWERVQRKILLTPQDEATLDKLLRGDLDPEDIQGQENAANILKAYEAKADYAALQAQMVRWRKAARAAMHQSVAPLLENTELAKDKKVGLLYNRETAERNIADVFPAADAEKINRAIFEPVHTEEAKSTKYKNAMRERVKELKLGTKPADGDLVSEAHAVQLLGEAQDNIRALQNRPMTDQRDGKTLREWEAVVAELWKTSPHLDKAKIENAVQEFRKIYDELFYKMNEVRVRNGYEPVAYRKGYFPHFQPGQSDGILSLMGKALGMKAEVTALPTSINGITHTFKPGITWFGNTQERLGFNTAYDAVEGFDRYIEGAANVIFQTDNIQRLRAFNQQLRYRTTDDGIRERVDAIRADDRLTMEEKETKVQALYEHAKFELGNMASWLDEYTNLLAGKKHSKDREYEQALGRGFYNVMKWLESRVAANMVAVNPGSWLTNFIPITQAWGYVSTDSILKAMGQTIRAQKNDDGFWENSVFLTNRRGSDPLVRSWSEQLSATLGKPMDWIDTFTADVVVRARYLENMKRGMAQEDAMREADRFAANIMADRSKGATPTMFQSRNPWTKLFTQFQLEVNNQFSNIFKDLPREARKRGGRILAMALFKMFFSAWLYNELYEKLVGRRAALDPIDLANDFVGDATGYKLNNIFDAALGDGLIRKGKPAGLGDAVGNFLGNTAEELPMIGGLMGGGRVPFSSALPDLGQIWSYAKNKEMAGSAKLEKIWGEVRDPLLYLALPFGGGQIRKVAQGIYAVAKGGKFVRNSKGELQMQYPVYTDDGGWTALRTVQALTFGRNATKEARQWVDENFSKLSAAETNAYLAMTAADVKQKDAWKLIKAMQDVEVPEGASKKQVTLEALNGYDISDEAKNLYYYNVIADDTEQAQLDAYMEEEQTLADEKIQNRIKSTQVTEVSEEEKAEKEAQAERDRASRANYAQMYRKIRDLKLDGYETIYKQQLKALKEQEGLSDSEARKKIQKGIRAEVKEAFQAGSIDEKMATRILSKNLNESEDDTYWILEEWKGGPEYSKYGKLKDAMKQDTDAKETVKYYLSHGVEKRDISAQITAYFKPLYKEAETRQEKNEIAKRANVFYYAAGYTDKWNDMMKWDKEKS